MKDATQLHIRPARPEEAGLFYVQHHGKEVLHGIKSMRRTRRPRPPRLLSLRDAAALVLKDEVGAADNDLLALRHAGDAVGHHILHLRMVLLVGEPVPLCRRRHGGRRSRSAGRPPASAPAAGSIHACSSWRSPLKKTQKVPKKSTVSVYLLSAGIARSNQRPGSAGRRRAKIPARRGVLGGETH